MRTGIVLAATLGLALALPLSAQEADPDRKVAGGGTLPAGWSARVDRDRPMENVKFEAMGNGFHVTLGPAVIFWRNADRVTGAHHVVATFTQTKAPTHPEAYGLFFAGSDLSGAGQQYVYFLVRGDGKFLIKKRTGATTANVTEGWTDHAAVVKQDAAGKQTNRLEITVGPDKVSYAVNGKEVWSTAGGSTDGIAGLRINHNLDVHIEGFGVHKR